MVGPFRKRQQSAENTQGVSARGRFVRWGRKMASVFLWGLAGLTLVLALVVFLPPLRSSLLGWGLGFVEEALPGRLTVGEAKWPGLGHLVLRDVLWIADIGDAPGDTLADVALIDLQLDLGALRERDGRVESLALDVRNVDVPFIVSATASPASKVVADTTVSDSPLGEIPFLDPGSLPGVPSATLDELDIEVARIRIAPGMVIRDMILAGDADVGKGRRATAVVDHVEARFLAVIGDTAGAPLWEVEIDHLGFGLNLEAKAQSEGGWKVGTAGLDSLNLKIAPTDNPALARIWAGSDPVILEAKGNLARDRDHFEGGLECDFVLPGSARFHPWLPADFPHDEFGSVTGRLGLTGVFENPEAQVELNLDFGSSTWLERGVVAINAAADVTTLKDNWIDAVTARLDTLDIQLEGIQMSGSGDWGPRKSDVMVDLDLRDMRLPTLFLAAAHPEWVDLIPAADQVGLDATARLGRDGTKFNGGLECEFELPGSSHFRTWLPEEFPHEEFDRVVGSLDLQGHYDRPGVGGRVRFDFGSNTWAERGLIAGEAETDLDELSSQGLRALVARLDTLEIGVEGISISSSGALGPEELVLDFEGVMSDFTLPGLFVSSELSPSEIGLRVDVALSGSLEEPEIIAEINGGMDSPELVVPAFDFAMEGDRRNVEAVVNAGGGLLLNGTRLDSLRAEVRGKAAGLDSMAINFGAGIWRDQNSVTVAGMVRGDTVRVVHVDSLVTRTFGREMRTKEPFTFTLGPGPQAFELTQMDFVGDPGSILARGLWNESKRDLEVAMDLLLGEELLQEVAPSPMWSLNGGADLKLDLNADLEGGQEDSGVSGRFSADLLPHREEPPLGIDLIFNSRGGSEALLDAEFTVNSADTLLFQAQLDWPGKAGPEGGFWLPDPDQDLVLTVPPQTLDLAHINRRLPDETVFRGKVDLAAEIHVFPPGKGDKPDSLALIPLRGSVEASLGIPRLKIDLPNRSWVQTVVDAQVEGTLADPKLKARVEFTSGFIRIPEIPRNLHPVEGHSYLWALNDSLLAAMDSTDVDSLAVIPGSTRTDSLQVFRSPEQSGPALKPPGPALLPEMEVEVAISNDIRIIGYGIDIKLQGGVKVTRGYDKDHLPGPSVKGSLQVVEGSLKAMNRVFTVERGNIKFNGVVPPDPNFDLMLESMVNAYLVRILISGRASAPVIQLTSEPDLNREDVMAVLLFGQPMNDLDTDQRGRMDEENDPSKELQKNMAGLAMAFGGRGLQEGMSDSFGVDVVQMGSDSSGGSTLMVGKFITPDIMLKYNQSLEKSGTYFMTLEYSLNRYFKLVSTYGQGEEASGGELQWSRRY